MLSIEQALTSHVDCANPPGMLDFDASRYMGVWYEQRHSAGQLFQDDSDVCQEQILFDLDGENFKIYNSAQPEGYGERKGIEGKGKATGTTGDLYAKFGPAFTPWGKDPNLIILSTDYDTYVVAYQCSRR